MKILILLIIPVSVLCKLSTNELRADVEHLTSVLFTNLERDPYLKNATFEQSKVFIDKQVANYMALMKKTHNVIEHTMTRRSLPIDKSTTLIKDNLGVYAVDSMLPLYSMSLQVPKDIHLFEHKDEENRDWYAIVLASKSFEDDLVIYKFKDESFLEITRASVSDGVKLGLTPLLGGIGIVVARTKSQKKAKLFHFVPKTRSLTKIQHLPAENASDVAIWDEHKEIFMTISMSTTNGSHEVKVPIYHWLGRHFDIVGYIKTYGAEKVTPFIIGSSHFLAVANFQNNFGQTNIFSEIFKYNRHLGKFESYQKISTNAAVDVKYYHLKGNYDNEHFLVFANLFEDDNGTRIYETNSIVYKHVEGYFIPFQSIKLNGVLQWLPVTGHKGEFALFALCKYDGIRIFQYNGWTFTESKLHRIDEAFSKGIASMRTYIVENKTLIVVANNNDHGTMTNIFELKFANKKMLNQFHDENLSWCQKNLEKYPLNRPEENNHSPSKREVAANNVNEELSKLNKKLKHYENEVEILERQLRLTLNSNEANIIDGDLHTATLTLINTDTSLESLTSEFINDENTFQFFESLINIDHDFIVENAFQLENVTTSEISPQYLNNHPAHSIVYSNNEEHLGEVIVNGDVVFQKGLLLDGKLNGINFTKENVLMKQGNQSLSSLDLNILAAELLDADFINDIDMSQIDSIQTKPRVVEKIDTLNVKTAHIKGLINSVDVSKLKEYALRTSGAQTITGKYKFDSLHVDKFNSNDLSGKNLTEELVLIDEGDYVLEQGAEFVNALETDTVIITGSLNHVFVVDGNLDILLVNSSEVQHVTGYKEFDAVELMNPIKLGGRITNKKIDQMNPVKVTDEEITLLGDYIIKGNLQVEQLLQTSEIQSAGVSVTNLQSNGVKLVDKKIPCHLQFLQQLNVEEVSTDAINGVLVDSLVVMGTDNEQVITGWKTFPGDVFVTGATKLEYVNGVHTPTLELDVLRITGDQTITGNHQFENIVANRVFNVKTVFGERLWENVVTAQPDQSIPGTTVITGTLQLDELETDSLVLLSNSLINGYNFTFMIEDAVFRNETLAISGATEFKNMLIENLYADNLDLTVIPKMINESTVTYQLDDNFSFPSRISIGKISFTGSLNDMKSTDFEDHWDDQIFRGDQTFNKIIVYRNLFVESGFLNDVNITRASEDSIKTDEDYHFRTATFKNGLASIYDITLDGQFESLDLNEVVLSHIQDTQIIVDEITFKSDVSINGEVVFNGLISGFNITEFCEFTNYNGGGSKSLHINGNAYFVKGPEVISLNQVPIKHVLETAWFTTQDCTVYGEMEFENVVFQEDVTVHGYVDDNKIQLVAHTYLSKTKNQNISAFYNFDDTVLFGNGVYAPRANIRGAVGEINLGEFVSTALLNNYEQVFENTVYLEDCEIHEFLGEYSVNDLNLENDVMRYDQNNVVAGKKIVSDVKSYTLKIDKNVLIQNVSLIPWMHDSVLKSGTFQLQGKVCFLNETTFSNGIGCQANVNGLRFNEDTIMLKSKPQTITATKHFVGNENQTIKFQSLHSEGLINGVDMNRLMQQQAYKNRDVVFESPVYFNGSIVTPNMHVEKLYQGVNISDLVNNITQLSSNHNYTENFEKLLQVSSKVKESLETHAYFLNYYKVKQMYQNIDVVIPVSLPNDQHQYLACITKENHKYTIKFEVWDSDAEHFRKAVDISPISAPSNLRYIKEIKFRGADHWYIEHEKTTLRAMYDKYEGSIFEITRSGLKQIVPAILHNGTKYVSSIDLPILNKCVFLLFTSKAFIYCQSLTASSSSSKYWNPFQEIETFNSVEGTVASVNNVTYIFILNAGTLNGPSSIDVWKFDINTKLFQKEQSIYVPYPTSITTICYKNVNFFAVASGYMQNSKYEGIIVIRKYDPLKQHYVKWQDIQLNVPIQVLFAELPTQELILYVSTNNPTQPLIMYQYEGISKFARKTVATTIPPSSFVKSFNTPDFKHFVLAQNGNETNVIEAVFKGQQK